MESYLQTTQYSTWRSDNSDLEGASAQDIVLAVPEALPAAGMEWKACERAPQQAVKCN